MPILLLCKVSYHNLVLTNYYDVNELLELVHESIGKKCGHPECQNVIGKRRSWDRMNNSLGHVRGNIRLLCSKACNSSLR